MIAATFSAAAVPAVHALRSKKWLDGDHLPAFFVITWLHVVQPLARLWGHIRGSWETRHSPSYPIDQRLYGNLTQRELWLSRLERHLQNCGWSCQPCDDWDVADLNILGPVPYRLKLCSVYEDDVEHGRHFVRYRVTARTKYWLPVVWLLLAGCVPLFFWRPSLVPLALPLAALARALIGVKRYMQSAVSQLAAECAEPLGMVKAEIQT